MPLEAFDGCFDSIFQDANELEKPFFEEDIWNVINDLGNISL